MQPCLSRVLRLPISAELYAVPSTEVLAGAYGRRPSRSLLYPAASTATRKCGWRRERAPVLGMRRVVCCLSQAGLFWCLFWACFGVFLSGAQLKIGCPKPGGFGASCGPGVRLHLRCSNSHDPQVASAYTYRLAPPLPGHDPTRGFA